VIQNTALFPKKITQYEMSNYTFLRFISLDTHFERSAGAKPMPLLTALITSELTYLLNLYSSASYTTRFNIQKFNVVPSQSVGAFDWKHHDMLSA